MKLKNELFIVFTCLLAAVVLCIIVSLPIEKMSYFLQYPVMFAINLFLACAIISFILSRFIAFFYYIYAKPLKEPPKN